MKLRKLSFDLSLVNLSATGFWFCRGCQKVTEREEVEGMGCGCCCLCGSPRIKWNPPVETPQLQPA